MTSCTGCNVTLGWKKYNFQKQWKISGYFCKECMKKIGRDFDDHGYITYSKTQCDSCNQEFFFLESIWYDKKRKRYCCICKNIDSVELSDTKHLPPVPSHIPMLMVIFAAFGILLMISGFIYVLFVAPQQNAGLLHIIIGSTMSGAGFILARKMIKIRNLILGKTIPKKVDDVF